MLEYYLLALNVIVTLVSRDSLLQLLFLITTIAFGIFSKNISALGALIFAALSASVWLYYRSGDEHFAEKPASKGQKSLFNKIKHKARCAKWMMPALFLISAVLIFECVTNMHHYFYNRLMFRSALFSSISAPYTLRLDFSGTIAAIVIYVCSRSYKRNRIVNYGDFAFIMMYSLIAGIISFFIGIATGLLRFDPKIPSHILIVIFNNLLFVCVRDQVLSRVWLQAVIAKIFGDFASRYYLHVIIASLVMSAAQRNLGYEYMLFMFSINCFCGYVYERTGRNVIASIFMYFFLNMAHLILFTYPYAR